jgi:thiamine biosynthesis lipoprotein
MPYLIKGARNIMGTFVTIIVAHPDVHEASKAVYAAFDEIYRINDLMSVHKKTSEVSILNREGRYQGLSADTRYVIQRANHLSELSEGAFDITILPVLNLWEEKARTGRVPTDAEIQERLTLVNHRNIVAEHDNIKFRKHGMGIILAGVAKGYAVDKAIEALKQCNIKHALVNAGGDIRAIGGKSEAKPWRIAIRDPINKTRMATYLEFYEQAIATSGTFHRPAKDIIDPSTGSPAQGLLSSTVITQTAIDADTLATSLFILGAKRGMELAKKLSGVKAIVITNDGGILKSA